MLKVSSGKKIIPTIVIGNTILQEPSDHELLTVMENLGVNHGHINT